MSKKAAGAKGASKTKDKEKESATYEERDIVLGKVRGFPPWPGMIVNPDNVPDTVQSERPSKKSNFYCVQFFPTGDYAWLVSKDISKLQTVEIEAYINEPFKKSGDLLQGYRTALDPTEWESKRAETIANAAAEDDGEDAEMADEEGEEDELDSEGGGAESGGKKKKGRASASGKVAGKKRKREAESSAAVRKGPKEREKEKKAAKKNVKSKAKGKAANASATVESEEDGEGEDVDGEDVHNAAAASPPPAKRARKDDDADDALQADPEAVKVRDWRHRLQKAFLSAKSTPDESDMPNLSTLFTTVESYTQMTIAQLQFSKIGKVMRHITALDDGRVPRDTEFRFRARAQALVERWQNVLGAGSGAGKEGGAGGAGAEEGTKKKAGGAGGNNKNGAKGGRNGANGKGKKDDNKDVEKEVNGTEEDVVMNDADAKADVDLNGASTSTSAPLAGGAAAADGDAQGDVDAQGDAEMAAPAALPTTTTTAGDADAPGEVEADAPGEAEAEAEVEADAPGDVEPDVPALHEVEAEAEVEKEKENDD